MATGRGGTSSQPAGARHERTDGRVLDEALATDNPAFAEAIEARGSRRQGLAAAPEMWRTPVDKVQAKAEPEPEPEPEPDALFATRQSFDVER